MSYLVYCNLSIAYLDDTHILKWEIARSLKRFYAALFFSQVIIATKAKPSVCFGLISYFDNEFRMANISTFFIIVGIVLLNAAQYVKNLDCPPDILRLMVGSKLELKWHYEMNVSFRDSWKIKLYVHKSDSKRRKLIELHRGHIELRPGSNSWTDKMDLSYTSAKITVLKTTFNHTGDYGIMFVPLNKRKTDILTKYTVVTIVGKYGKTIRL